MCFGMVVGTVVPQNGAANHLFYVQAQNPNRGPIIY